MKPMYIKGIKNFFEISIGYIQKDDKYDSDDVKGLKVILNAEEDDEAAEIILEFLVSNGVKILVQKILKNHMMKI